MSFRKVLRRDSFFAPEVDIFRGFCAWRQSNADPENLVLNSVRLPLMSVNELLCVVRPAGYVDPDDLLDAIAEQNSTKHSTLPHRGQLCKFYIILYYLHFVVYLIRI